MFHFSAWSVIPVNRIGDLLAQRSTVTHFEFIAVGRH